jgi:hypothetical protein
VQALLYDISVRLGRVCRLGFTMVASHMSVMQQLVQVRDWQLRLPYCCMACRDGVLCIQCWCEWRALHRCLRSGDGLYQSAAAPTAAAAALLVQAGLPGCRSTSRLQISSPLVLLCMCCTFGWLAAADLSGSAQPWGLTRRGAGGSTLAEQHRRLRSRLPRGRQDVGCF